MCQWCTITSQPCSSGIATDVFKLLLVYGLVTAAVTHENQLDILKWGFCQQSGSVNMVVFSHIKDNRVGCCLLDPDFTHFEVKRDIGGNLLIFTKEIQDGFRVLEIGIKVFLEAFAKALLPCVGWRFP